MIKNDWIHYFPYDNPRQSQVEAIDKILKGFEDKKFYALEAGTGIGKSAIGYTVAKKIIEEEPPDGFVRGAIFVTTQKVLQEQYIKDFGKKGLCSISSSSNYQCSFKGKNSCQDSQNELVSIDQNTSFWKACTFNCNYKKKKQEFLESPLSITNFSYLLTEANFNGKIKPRQLLIIDEAHNVESELSKFIEISISEKFCKTVLKLAWPDLTTQLQHIKWIQEVYFPKLHSHCAHIASMLDKYKGIQSKLDDFASLSSQLKKVTAHYEKISKFLDVYSKENWVMTYEMSLKQKTKKLVFKPIDVSVYAEQYLFRLGYRVLFMSATLLNTEIFLENLGIAPNNSEMLALPSPFPVENRPILHVAMGKMSAKHIQKTLPNLAKGVEQILNHHPDSKGIIHTHSYAITKFLKQNIKSNRLLFPTPDNKEQILRKHMNSKKPTVLVSPSLTEGLDLSGELSRFQILCKIPYPYLGDNLVKKRMNKWSWWYSFQTAKTVVQSIGRSIRSIDDKAVTYILDTDWSYFYSKNKELFPSDFSSCIK